MFYGCAEICEFGRGGGPGMKCYGNLSQAQIGMTQKQIEQKISVPQQRRTDVTYRGKVYDEAWIYNTDPPTILYFKNGVLEHKDYQSR